MRCCANCEWSISPMLEKHIMEEQGYDENDLNRPHAGDCVIGSNHNGNFVCSSHLYCDGTEEINLMYDEKYMGTGYLLVNTVNDELERFIKISIFGDGFPSFSIRGYEVGSKDNLDSEFRSMIITIDKSNFLYESLKILVNDLNGEFLYSIDSHNQGKNNIQFVDNGDSVSIILNKDIMGVKDATKFIDITLGDRDTCKCYAQLLRFYNSLAYLPVHDATDKDIKKLLLEK